MSYIGKSPAVGNFVKLDAISTSSTNTYNLTVDSVAFVPESANHMLVSLNGVIQSPLSSFSVSGSTITFLPSSGTLSSSDSIDFIMVYGNILDVGVATTVTDSAITKGKLNLISDSSSAGLTVKGDGSSENGTIALNCSSNSHAVKLSSPSHASGQSYEMILPATNITAGKFLKVDSVSGSGATGIGQLSFADAGGGKILQVVGSSGIAGFDTNSTSYVPVTGTGHGLAITPSATSSKIFISIMFEAKSSSVSNYSINTILRGTTNLGANSTDRMAIVYGSSIDFPLQLQFLDSPNTTSEITYSIGTKSNNSSHNSRINASNQTFSYVAMEIGA